MLLKCLHITNVGDFAKIPVLAKGHRKTNLQRKHQLYKRDSILTRHIPVWSKSRLLLKRVFNGV